MCASLGKETCDISKLVALLESKRMHGCLQSVAEQALIVWVLLFSKHSGSGLHHPKWTWLERKKTFLLNDITVGHVHILLKISFKGVSFTRNTICPSRIFLERFLRTHWRGKAEIKERKQRRWTRQHPCSSAEPPSAAVGEHTVCCGLQTEGEWATE